MKLQVDGQKLRVRIDEAELARLLDGHALQSVTLFGDAFSIRVTIELEDGEVASLTGEASAWRIAIPATALQQHATQLPSRDGLHFMLSGQTQAAALELLFDVDVRDSVRRRRNP
jgi:hypothetical protein